MMKDEDYEQLVDRVEEAVYEVKEALERFDDCRRNAEFAFSERRADAINRLIASGFVPGAQFDFDAGKKMLVFVGYTCGGRLIFNEVGKDDEITVDAPTMLEHIDKFRAIGNAEGQG